LFPPLAVFLLSTNHSIRLLYPPPQTGNNFLWLKNVFLSFLPPFQFLTFRDPFPSLWKRTASPPRPIATFRKQVPSSFSADYRFRLTLTSPHGAGRPVEEKTLFPPSFPRLCSPPPLYIFRFSPLLYPTIHPPSPFPTPAFSRLYPQSHPCPPPLTPTLSPFLLSQLSPLHLPGLNPHALSSPTLTPPLLPFFFSSLTAGLGSF